MIPSVPPQNPEPERQPDEPPQEELPYVLTSPRRSSAEYLRSRLIAFAMLGGLFVTLLLSCVLSTLSITLPRPTGFSLEVERPSFPALLVTYGASLVAPMILVFAIIGAADVIARTIGRASSRTADAFLKGTRKRETAAPARGNLTDDIVSDYFQKRQVAETEQPENG
jgi:hypothetical protein